MKKWGNCLALRVTAVMAKLSEFHDVSKVTEEVSEEGFTVRPTKEERRHPFPYTEKELLAEMSPEKSHADELAKLSEKEYGDDISTSTMHK